MMKNLLKIFVLTFTIIACKNNSTELKTNETIEYYANNPNVVFKKTLNLTDFDSVYYFYDNGVLFKKGKLHKENQKFGNWELYDRDSNLREIQEWFTVYGVSRINRAWQLNKKGDTIAYRDQDVVFEQKEFMYDTTVFRGSNYSKIQFQKDTIRLNEPVIGHLECYSRVITDYKSNVRLYLPKDDNQFNFDFSNQKKIELDTFYDLTIDKKNQKWFPVSYSDSYHRIVVFEKRFKSTGKKYVRGFYHDYYKAPVPLPNDSIESIRGFNIYFEKEIIVIDSIEQNHSVQQRL